MAKPLREYVACNALTEAGHRCKNMTAHSQTDLCHVHLYLQGHLPRNFNRWKR